MKRAKLDAQGRLDHGPPVAVIDIGSNSVRLKIARLQAGRLKEAGKLQPHHVSLIKMNNCRMALDVARDAIAVSIEQTCNFDVLRILEQSIFDFLQQPLRRIRCKDLQLFDEQSIVLVHHIDGGLPIHEPKQRQGAQEEGAGDSKRPAKRGCSSKIRQAHGA